MKVYKLKVPQITADGKPTTYIIISKEKLNTPALKCAAAILDEITRPNIVKKILNVTALNIAQSYISIHEISD